MPLISFVVRVPYSSLLPCFPEVLNLDHEIPYPQYLFNLENFTSHSLKSSTITADIATASGVALRRLVNISASIRNFYTLKQLPVTSRLAGVRAMATLGSHEQKHKVTVVGSGNW